MAFNGKNIKFLQGAYSNLPTNKSEVGAFYVTNDTHEIFLGIDANKAPVALNRWVDVQDNWAAIQSLTDYKQHPGKIYYAKAENILCTWTGTEWKQINPDTDTDTILTSVDVSDAVKKIDEETQEEYLEYTFTFNQKNIDDQALESLTAVLKITGDDITDILVDVNVGVSATVKNGVATVSAVGEGSDPKTTFDVRADTNITIQPAPAGSNGFTIKGTAYDLTSEDNKIILSDSNDGPKDEVELVGDTWIDIAAGSDDNQIAITHKAPVGEGSKVKSNETPLTDLIDVKDHKFSALTGVKADANGHIISTEVTEFTIPNTVYTLDVTEGTATLGEVSKNYTTSIELVDDDDKDVSSVAIKTAHKINIDGTDLIIENGGDFGAIYSASKIDSKLKAVDAMVYKGTVDSQANLPTTNVQIGNTYKASKDFTYAVGETIIYVSKGDLLIANGTEGNPDANGNAYITGTISWDHIESGADDDTQYTFTANNDKLTLTDSVDENAQNVELAGDGVVSLSATGNTLSVAHATFDKKTTPGTAAPGYAQTFEAVSAIERDDHGHIKDVTVTTVTLPGADKIVVTEEDPTFAIKTADDVAKGSIVFKDSDKITATGEIVDADSKILEVTFEHNKLAKAPSDVGTTDLDCSIALDGETNTFDVLDSVVVDDYGHITDFKKKTVTVAKETTYTLTGPETTTTKVDGKIDSWTSTITFSDSNDVSTNIALKSKTLQQSSVDGVMSIDLVWDSF